MNYAEEQMKYAEEIKRSFDKIENIPWPSDKLKEVDSMYMFVEGNTSAGIKEPEEKEEKEDVVNRPLHYAESCSIECIDAMECMFGTDKLISFCFMNAFKYIWRFKNKNGLEDLKKARWYLDKSYELAHSEWATDSEVRSEDYLALMEENYLKLDTLLNKAAFKGGYHGV